MKEGNDRGKNEARTSGSLLLTLVLTLSAVACHSPQRSRDGATGEVNPSGVAKMPGGSWGQRGVPGNSTNATERNAGVHIESKERSRGDSTPRKPDRDGDGMSDEWEIRYGLNPSDPSDKAGDPDGDGLANLREYESGTRPDSVDSDGDGLVDGKDRVVSLDQTGGGAFDPARGRAGPPVQRYAYDDNGRIASVSSSMTNRFMIRGRESTRYIYDGAGNRVVEIRTQLKQVKSGLFEVTTTTFTPNNALNLVMLRMSYVSDVKLVFLDSNMDGFADGEESWRTDPAKADSDGDGLSDGWEAQYSQGDSGFDPTDGRKPDLAVDPDGDGLSNREEFLSRSNPFDFDTDRDGLIDGSEMGADGKGRIAVSKYPNGVDANTNGFVDGEADYGTSPTKVDSDDDGLPDRLEILEYKTNPAKADSDGNGEGDAIEVEVMLSKLPKTVKPAPKDPRPRTRSDQIGANPQ